MCNLKQPSKSNSISSSLAWNLLERLGTQGTQMIVSIILARILMPEAYGILSLITVFINLATVVVETGFGSSIIQKKNLQKREINTVFTFNLVVSLVLCSTIWLCAPLIADFYSKFDRELLIRVIRVYSLILPVGAVTSIQSAMIYRDMQFKKFFVVNISVIILSSAIGIGMALGGGGVWALVFQHLSAKVILLFALLFAIKWKPWLDFRFKQCMSLFRFGGNILFNRLLNMLYNQASSLVIGKKYTSDMLAYYTKANTFPSLIATNTDYALQKVMFSAYSKHQDNLAAVKQMMRKTISVSTFLLSPLLFGLLACSKNFILVLLTDKWLPSQIYMQIFCISFFLQPIGTTAAQAFNGIGKSNITLWVGVVTKVIGILVIFATVPFGVVYIAWGVLATTVLSSVVYMIVNRWVFSYSFRQQLWDVGVNMLTAATMAVVCLTVGWLCSNMAPIAALCLQVLAGAVWYIGISVAFKNQNMKFLVGKIKTMLKK